MLRGLLQLLRVLALLGLVGTAGWWTLFLRDRFQAHEEALATRDARIARLGDELAEKERRIATLETALRLLKVDRRVARLEVLEQGPNPDQPGRLRTRVRFTELGPDGRPLAPGREYLLQGGRAYVEALVVKFADRLVEAGDPFRGTSICLFTRLFGEGQAPEDGFPLDSPGSLPAAYSLEEPGGSFQQEIWQRFWEYANDPARAATRGIRAIHGEAPFMELRPGGSYRVELRASGGLSILAE